MEKPVSKRWKRRNVREPFDARAWRGARKAE
jgi:hypothetical protein